MKFINLNREFKLDILTQLAVLGALLNELGVKLADSQKALDEATKAAYDKGFADGSKIVIVEPSDKIFSQKEADLLVLKAVEPLEKKIADLELLVAGIDGKIEDALVAFKADLLLKVAEIDAIEDKALAELLK